MLPAIDLVAEIMAKRDLDAFTADLQAQRAMEGCIEIVSEASRRVPEADKAQFPDVPWRNIAAIGNVFRARIPACSAGSRLITATQSLPNLRPTILAMMVERR